MKVDDDVTAEFFRNIVLNHTGGEYHYTSKYAEVIFITVFDLLAFSLHSVFLIV